MLDVRLSRPIEGEGTLVVRSQAALGSFPVRAEPLRLTPEGAVRHSGYVRVANDGAVRLEVADATGMMQLAPEQFPGEPVEDGVRQVFVYRFASADYGYRVVADQIVPEVNVSQIATYEIAETDRVINADIELDIREAPLREWTMTIPADYSVVSVTGNNLADYAPETEANGGTRNLKMIFADAIDGRQLLHLRLEKNQAAGGWASGSCRRCCIRGRNRCAGMSAWYRCRGIASRPGRRTNLVEVPLSYFPNQVTGLQQAYRLREPGWSATMEIDALGQSVQADVFHLYSLKEGVVYGSVLINYFVVGAPANEWRIAVPKAAGNIDVVGQNVQREWRREGDQIIVSLHQPVLGPATLLVTFEQPMSARGGTIDPGEVQPLGVQGERGYIQVVSPLEVKYDVTKADGGLLKLEPLELPTEFRLLTSSPVAGDLSIHRAALRAGDECRVVSARGDGGPGGRFREALEPDFARWPGGDGCAVLCEDARRRRRCGWCCREGVKLWEARVGERGGQRPGGRRPDTGPAAAADEPERAGRGGAAARADGGAGGASGADRAEDARADGHRRMDVAQRSGPAARAAGRDGGVAGIERDGERVRVGVEPRASGRAGDAGGGRAGGRAAEARERLAAGGWVAGVRGGDRHRAEPGRGCGYRTGG